MDTKKVSQDFNKFYAKNATAIAEVKKAEARANNCPVPVGTLGQVVLVDFVLEKAKDKTIDGVLQEGMYYAQMKFNIINHPQHKGKTLTKFSSFYDSANMTAMKRYEWFLNDLEFMGLPREIRTGHDSPQQLVDFFMKEPMMFDFEVLADNPAYNDGKKLQIRRPAEQVPDIPHAEPGQPAASRNPVTETDMGESVGSVVGSVGATSTTSTDTVMYLGKSWNIIGKEGSKVNIKDPVTGNMKVVDVSQLD